MNLQEILYGVRLVSVVGSTNCQVASLVLDSRKVIESSIFFAVKGEAVDGHQYISSSIAKGANVIVCSEMPDALDEDVVYVQVADVREAVAIMAANFYGHPSKELKLIGITGTNGKTSIATFGFQLFTELGAKVGLMSTIENKIGNQVIPTKLTTPDVITVNALLREMVNEGCEIAFMEVSSHAVEQKRIYGLHFTAGVFTNITRDHLDYHKTFKAYITAKQKFFDHIPKSSFVVYNEDDRNGQIMVQNTKARKVSYGLKSFATYKVKILENSMDGLLLNLGGVDFYTRVTGDFNALNLTAIYAVAMELGEEQQNVLEVLSTLKGAAGRFQKIVSEKNVVALVDYAHTPDALEKVLNTINSSRTMQEQLFTVVGCGGNRDKGKRPLMASVASELSTKAILTSDNPRDEEPAIILSDMLEGVKITQRQKVMTVLNRKEAIRTAVSMAESGDIILVAGKGHETYQEINGERFPFDDKEVIQEAFQEFNK